MCVPKRNKCCWNFAFFGLVYARCLQGQNSVRMELLFSENYEHSVFSTTVSKNRTLHWKKDRFAAIRNFFEKSNNNCGKPIIPGDLLSIDKKLYPIRNKVAFKQFNPNRSGKYGLLFKNINASRYLYSFVSAPYFGKPVREPTE